MQLRMTKQNPTAHPEQNAYERGCESGRHWAFGEINRWFYRYFYGVDAPVRTEDELRAEIAGMAARLDTLQSVFNQWAQKPSCCCAERDKPEASK